MWYWLNNYDWIVCKESDAIEEEYKLARLGKRSGQKVYYSFGDGSPAYINFNTMTTYCGSGRCQMTHVLRNIDNNHISYRLQRLSFINYNNETLPLASL